MIDTQTALRELVDCLKRLDIDFTILKQSDDIQIQTFRDGVQVECWFDSSKSEYGFNMIQGGIKSYDDIAKFEKYFKTYMGINTVFIPNAKRVADYFEKEENIQTIYNAFRGSESSGYTAIFNVLDYSTREVVVITTQTPRTYTLKYIDNNTGTDDTKAKVLKSLTYKVSEVGEVEVVPDINYYLGIIAEKYKDDPDISINRTGVSTFDFIFSDISVTALVVFDETEISYLITDVNGKLTDNQKVILVDPYNLAELHQIAQGFAQTEHVSSLANSVNQPDSFNDDDFDFEESDDYPTTDSSEVSDVIESPEVDVVDSTKDSDFADSAENLDEDSDEVSDTVETTEIVSDHSEVLNSPELSSVDTESLNTEASSDNALKEVKLVEVDGNPKYLRFDLGTEIYDVALSSITLPFPVEAIAIRIPKTVKKGIFLTDEERSRRIFAKDITSQPDRVMQLLELIF